MNDAVLAIADVTGIQSYVFGSNRLRDHVGGSELVAQATGAWAAKALQELGATNCQGVNAHGKLVLDGAQRFEDGALVSELLYSGGGNIIALMRDAVTARRWGAALSSRVERDAPGLGVAIVHSAPFTWRAEGHDLGGKIGALIDTELRRAKQYRAASTPLLGLGVSAECRVTGLPAVGLDETDGYKPVAREVVARLNAIPEADRRFRAMLRDYVGADRLGFDLPARLDDLGRSYGERSYIAVVHADGNGMGKRFKAIWAGHQNRKAIELVRKLSDAVHEAGLTALGRALAPLITPVGGLVKPFDRQDYLPIRPLIYGGDDVTFVCDGRLGVQLAAAYVEQLKDVTSALPDGAGAVTTAAGVAIVKTHYPFRRAYDLSESLCRGAKDTLGRERSSIDWHVAMSGLLADLKTIREREYQLRDGEGRPLALSVRPLPMVSVEAPWRTWGQFSETIRALQSDTDWAGRRNKVKQLREVLREGGSSTEQFLALYGGKPLPGYSAAPATLHRRGWLDGVCGYFDPIELLDLYVQL